MRAALDPEALLTLWERGLGQRDWARDEALLQASPESAAPARSLGERNAKLMALHARLFGREIELLSHCPACGTAVQFSGDAEALAAQMQPNLDVAPPYRLQFSDHQIEFRLPDTADIATASAEDSDEDFTKRLLDRCVLACARKGSIISPRQLPAPVLEALSRRMEALDPGASVSFAVECPQCAANWQAPLAIGPMLWQKVQAAAERLLLEVDMLARVYGWSETEVLRLSPTRRAAYLQLAGA